MRIIACLSIIYFGCSSIVLASPKTQLVGEWHCEPYEISHSSFLAKASEKLKFRENGEYQEIETSRTSFVGTDEVLDVTVVRTGFWKYQDQTITFEKKSARVVDYKSSKITLEQLQNFEDETVRNTPKSEFIVTSLSEVLIYKVKTSSLKEVAEQTYECKKV